MKKKNYSCVIYDLDGTLIDSSLDLANAINFARKEQDLKPITVTEVIAYIGGGAKNLVNLCFHEKNSDKDRALADFKKYYAENCVVETTFYEGVLETIKELHNRGIVQAVATNKPENLSKPIIEKLGLNQFMSIIIGGENKQKCELKPHPATLEYIARKFNKDINECLMVGDNHTDIEAAHNCNMDVAFCAFGLGEHNKLDYTYRISKFSKLLQIV
ncbi:HAD-IIIA family hydrolase [Lentisphaerota bacterium WC36G]|nr:HAD-IIIA family hydrolase [Lentisphaerae bacterium WC36]